MTWWLVIGAVLGTLFIRYAKKRLQAKGRTKSFAFHLARTSLDAALAFDLALLFWLLVWALVGTAWRHITLRHLLAIETYLSGFRDLLATLKLNSLRVFVGLLVIYLLSLLQRPFLRRLTPKLIAVLDRYHRTTKLAYMFLVFVTSLTLLGTRFGEPSTELGLRIKMVREGYACLCEEARETVGEAAARQVFKNSLDAMPEGYRTAIASLPRMASETDALRQYYGGAVKERNIRSAKAEKVLREAEARKGLSTRETSAKPMRPECRPPEELTHSRVEAARAVVAGYRSAGEEALVKLPTDAESGRLSMQVPKVITYSLKKGFFSEFMKTYPIFEPLIDVFVDSIDETVKGKLESGVAATAEDLLQGSEPTEKVLERAVGEVVASAKTVLPDTVKQAAQKATKQMDDELRSISAARDDVARQIERSFDLEVDQLIRQLYSRDEERREQACEKLCGMANRLSKRKVTQFAEIMQHGQETWSKFLYREHHCEWYEDTSIKHYAARVLSASTSPSVTQAVRTEAAKWEEEGKSRRRVTDPGWI
ncbi:MAG: hypothetical protein AB1714_01590 [Acidobacteriota bacterium]